MNTDSKYDFVIFCDPLYSSKDEYYGLEYYEGNINEMKNTINLLEKAFIN
jgi:hypothetical protein